MRFGEVDNEDEKRVEAMSDSKPRVLVMSSVPLSVGPAKIAEDYYLALRNAGINADLLLPYEDCNHPEYLTVYKSHPSYIARALDWVFKRTYPRNARRQPYCFFYHSEKLSPFPVKDVMKAIRNDYDLVLTVFWQEGFSFRTIEALYEKLRCVFYFICVDYSTMSGGCHFPGDCIRFKTGCGVCPAYRRHFLDFTKSNVQYRRKVISRVRPILGVNNYQYESFYSQSYLWKNYERISIEDSAIIDTDVFCPRSKTECRRVIGLSDSEKFIILIGCQDLSDPRKGIEYLIEALSKLFGDLTQDEREMITIVAIGRHFERIQSRIPFKTVDLGYRTVRELPAIYSAASCFVCASVNDPGPMMVNQALCCGVPVVGFDMGSVKMVVKNQGTGYCARLKDTSDLAAGIEKVFRLPPNEYVDMKLRCRNKGLETSSYASFVNRLMKAYNRYARLSD